MSDRKLSRRDLLKTGALTTAAAALPGKLGAQDSGPQKSDVQRQAVDPMSVAMLVGSLPNPLMEGGGFTGVWTQAYWNSTLPHVQDYGYNALVYYANPWTQFQWPSYMIQNNAYPEARAYSTSDVQRVIDHLNWVFSRAKQFGIKSYLFCHYVYTPLPFAQAHGYAQDMPVSLTVHGNHNNAGLGEARHKWGVRTELTRAYTQSTITEALQTYPDLEGFMGTMGESMPGKRSAWYRDAIVPGLKAAGRATNPPYILFHWIMPFEDFMEDIAPASVYDNTWLAIEHNGEGIDSAKTYPISARWAEESGMPTIVQIVTHNVDGEWYRGKTPQIGSHDSPKLAYEIVDNFKRIKNCVGFNYHFLAGDLNNPMFKRALTYYGMSSLEYSDDPWLDRLETRYGNRTAAQHILKAFDVSARITPEMGALAWCPHDFYIHARLSLRFWFFGEDNVNWAHFASAAREGGLMLMPLRYYCRAAAKYPSRRDNNGSQVDSSHPSQELIWGHIDYSATPEAHLRKIKAMGLECRREMEAALPLVTANQAEAQIAFHYMKSHELLTIYYEKKVLAAISALLYTYGQQPQDKPDAESYANQAVAAYETAIGYVKQYLDENRNWMKSKWANEYLTLDQLITAERQDRDNMPNIFKWPNVWDGTGVFFEEDWNTGSIDSNKWLVSVGQQADGSKCQLENLGSGDYAIFTEGPSIETGSNHTTYFYSRNPFPRGGNLHCTFKAWIDPSKTDNWTGGNPAHAMIAGPFHTNNTAPPYSNPEAMIRYWGTPYFTQDGDPWHTGGHATSASFNTAFHATTSKANALTIRVTLGNLKGARMEWSRDGGQTWSTEVDTREVSGSGNSRVYLGFATYGSAVFIDDIVLQNDAGVQPEPTSEKAWSILTY